MFSDPATIRADLKARLIPLLPSEWRFEDGLKEAYDTVVPIVYVEFTGVSSSANGAPLSRHTVAVSFDLVVASAGSADEDGADAHLVTLAHVLQRFDDIYWDTLTKTRLEKSGAYAWKFPLTLLSTLEE
ncbi:hypothetical protein [Microbacterium aurum]|uniref:hypothetical protein n=1 Tax=Microbacterium aurum TaxID=36805 RepID=UPI0028E26CCD|nr:hypothetical protein [Microbacterium aurum]